MSLSKESKEGFFESLLNKYLNSLQKRPLLTKSCTRFVVCFSIFHSLFLLVYTVVMRKIQIAVFLLTCRRRDRVG